MLPDGSVNFSIVSQSAKSIELCLFTDSRYPTLETHRIPVTIRRGDTWYLSISGIPETSTYGYRVDGIWDPLAGLVYNPNKLLPTPVTSTAPHFSILLWYPWEKTGRWT